MFTDYEKEHPITLLTAGNDYLLAMIKVLKIAEENNWYVISHELEEKIGMMEKRIKELLEEVTK